MERLLKTDSDLDVIGEWSEVKLEIIRKYARAYSLILATRENPRLYHVYVDAFAGAGINIARRSGKPIAGSPLNALMVNPPFREYHFIDKNRKKVARLRELAQVQPTTGIEVYVYEGNCNEILLREIFPRIRYEYYRRGLCFLDPYGLDVDWTVIQEAARTRAFDLFINVPIMDMNRNVLWGDPSGVPQEQVDRMNRFWGDETWRQVAYRPKRQLNLFGEPGVEKRSLDEIAGAFRERLRRVAGFQFVPQPVPLKNTKHNPLFYLFFAAHVPVAEKIVTAIFNKYRRPWSGGVEP